MPRRQVSSLLAAGLLSAALAAPADAQVSLLNSDAEYTALVAAGGFTKFFGGIVRAGNNAGNGDWEYSVVNAADSPLDQKQLVWGSDPRQVTFEFLGQTAGLTVAGAPAGTSTHTFGTFGEAINTVFIRARASAGRVASFSNIFLSFAGGAGSIDLGTLVGDSNAEYIRITDARFANGFTITGDGLLAGGSGSDPAFGFKVGTAPQTVVPEPMSMLLLGTGLAGVAAARRRRKKEGELA